MRGPLRLRALNEEEEQAIKKLAHSRTASARLVERAKIIELAKEGVTIPQIMRQLHLSEHMVRKWWKRFEEQGLAGLEDAPRPGAPSRYTAENKARVLEAALSRPSDLNPGFHCWTFERLAAYVHEHLGIHMQKTRIFEILQEEGLKWRKQETWFGERLDPEFAKKGAIEAVRKDAGADSVILDIDEMGPTSAKSYPGQEVIKVSARPAQRAKQEIDYGRRAFGYVYGALWETTGQCWTECYPGRCAVHFVDFLCYVDEAIPEDKKRIYAIMDNLEMHHCRDLLLFMINHPRWEFVYQPTYAAYLNLIEPWWKVLRSLALKGKRFENWQEIVEAVKKATTYWNAHKHPFVWGRRRRHQPPRPSRKFTFQVKTMRI